MKTKQSSAPKAAIYVRVSSRDQTKGVSQEVQKKQCRALAVSKGFQVHRVFYDAGISGKAMAKRAALRAMLDEAKQGSFRHVIIWSISRFGRNLRDLAENMLFLREKGVTIHSLKEGIDSSNAYGKMVFQVLGAVSELEAEMIAERTSAARIYLADKGIPSEGRQPLGRKWVFDAATQRRSEGHWELDEDKAEAIRDLAKRYLQGESLKEISLELLRRFPEERSGMTYLNLLYVLKHSCGDVWKTKHGTFRVPRLLDDLTIARVKKQIYTNYRAPRNVKGAFAFKGGYLRCYHCGTVLIGQTQTRGSSTYLYYRHAHAGRLQPCKHFASITAKLIEDAVFKCIFENTADEGAFQEAVAEALPDSKDVAKLQEKIRKTEKAIKAKQVALDRLAAAVAQGVLRRETTKRTEDGLHRELGELSAELERDRRHLGAIPDPVTFAKEAKAIRQGLADFYGGLLPANDPGNPAVHGRTWYELMTFQHKTRLVRQIFPKDEVASDGKPYGVFLEKTPQGAWNFYIRALFFSGWVDDIFQVKVDKDSQSLRPS